MKIKAEFGDLKIEVETASEDKAVALFGYWYTIVCRILADDAAPASVKTERETHH